MCYTLTPIHIHIHTYIHTNTFAYTYTYPYLTPHPPFPSQVCFAVGVSGSISCVIRGAPLFGFSRQGVVSVFAAQGREQFYLEGIAVAALTLLLASLLK
ncbi:hypothetical protein EON64_14900, partial [archaeon]